MNYDGQRNQHTSSIRTSNVEDFMFTFLIAEGTMSPRLRSARSLCGFDGRIVDGMVDTGWITKSTYFQ